MTTVAIIDADSICHAVSWNYKGNESKFDEALANVKKNIRNIEEHVFADYSLIAVKSNTNFRDQLYSEYKANRKNTKEKTLVPALRKKLVTSGVAVRSTDREADDLMRIWSEEARQAGHDYYICSIDKDLDCIPGKHLYIKDFSTYTVTEEEALRHYWEQILKGDPVDNIPGVPKIGPTKAKVILSDCHTAEEFESKVVDEYKKYYKEEWYEYLLVNGRLIHLQKTVNDYFKLNKEKYKEV